MREGIHCFALNIFFNHQEIVDGLVNFSRSNFRRFSVAELARVWTSRPQFTKVWRVRLQIGND